ncbi:MAG: DUF2809 domain-containing protein [Ruminococcus sp.]|nr:DUF2809 domain-containing protein [Ruminococcus sp.]
MKRRLPYIIIFVLLVGVEVLIALTQHGNFIRYYGGDVIVMWVLYCLVQAVLGGRNNHYLVNLCLLAFAFAVEFVQKWGFADKFGIESPFLRTLIGTSFAVEDLWSYLAGTAIACAGVFVYGLIRRNSEINSARGK